MDEARAHYDAALTVAREVGDRRREGIVLCNLGILHREQGRMDEARAHYDAALAVAREVGDRRRRARARQPRHTAAHSSDAGSGMGRDEGSLQLGTALRRRALGACWRSARSGTAAARASCSATWASCTTSRAGWTRPARTTTRRWRWPARSGTAASRASCSATSATCCGSWASTARPSSTSLMRSHSIAKSASRYGQPHWLGGLALIEADAGRRDAALALALEAVAVAAPFPAVQLKSLETLARVHLARGEVPAAREAIARARALAPRRVAQLAAVDALVAVAEGDRAAAEAAVAEATADPATVHAWQRSRAARGAGATRVGIARTARDAVSST